MPQTKKRVRLFLEGRIPSKKNSRKVFIVKGRIVIAPSTAHERWHRDALVELSLQAPPNGIKKCDVIMEFTFPDNRKTDLSNKAESVMDLLVDAGVLYDDSWQCVSKLSLLSRGVKKQAGVHVDILY